VIVLATLNWQRPLWEGDQEIVKRSGTDEPIWVVIFMYMEATLGISLYSYLYLKLSLSQKCVSKCKNNEIKEEKIISSRK
jgi:hypothetical protein